MPTKTASHLFSLGQFFFICTLLGLGASLIAFDRAPHLRAEFIDMLQEGTWVFSTPFLSFIGGSLVVLGLVFLLLFYFLHRGHFYRFVLHPHKVTIEEALISSCIQKFWHHKFPKSGSELHVKLHAQQTIEIIAEVPSLFPHTYEKELEETEQELGELLAKQLGATQEFFLTLVFK